MPATSLLLLASTGPLGSVVRSPGGPPGSQGPGPCQVDRTSSCEGSCDGQLGSSSPLFRLLSAARRLRAHAFVVVPQGCASPRGSASSGGSFVCSPLRGNTSGLHLPFCGSALGGVHAALSCAFDINASGLAAMAFSASLAGSALAVSLARAGAAPTTGSAPPCSFASMLEGSGSLASTFLAIAAGPRWP